MGHLIDPLRFEVEAGFLRLQDWCNRIVCKSAKGVVLDLAPLMYGARSLMPQHTWTAGGIIL
jgi:hypothetical protein